MTWIYFFFLECFVLNVCFWYLVKFMAFSRIIGGDNQWEKILICIQNDSAFQHQPSDAIIAKFLLAIFVLPHIRTLTVVHLGHRISCIFTREIYFLIKIRLVLFTSVKCILHTKTKSERLGGDDDTILI